MKLRNDAGACGCKGKLNTGYFGSHVVHRAPCHQPLRMVNSTAANTQISDASAST
jgi:hypothetical protein